MTRWDPWAGIAAVLAGAILSGCTFSSGGTTEVTESGEGAAGTSGAGSADGSGGAGGSAPDRKPAHQRRSGPHVSALCDSLTAVYLTNISDQDNAAEIVNDWAKVTAAAPASLKKDLTTVGAYLVAAAKGDYAGVKRASDLVDDALDHIDRYVTKVCRA